MQELIKKALDGDAVSRFVLGNLFAERGAAEKAAEWYGKAASQGLPDAQFSLAKLVYGPRPEQQERAVRLLADAAGQGLGLAWNELERIADEDVSRPARFALGKLYLRPPAGRPPDAQKAARWLSEAALDGEAGALEELFSLATRGADTAFFDALALTLETAPHSIPGKAHSGACFRLAKICRERKLADKAEKWFDKAAQEGCIEALCEWLDMLVSRGDGGTSLRNVEKQLWERRKEIRQQADAAVKRKCGKVFSEMAAREFEMAGHSVASMSGPVADILRDLAGLGNEKARAEWETLSVEREKAAPHADQAIDLAEETRRLSAGGDKTTDILLSIAANESFPDGIRHKAHFFAGEALYQKSTTTPDEHAKLSMARQAAVHFRAAGTYDRADSRFHDMMHYIHALQNPTTMPNYSPAEGDD